MIPFIFPFIPFILKDLVGEVLAQLAGILLIAGICSCNAFIFLWYAKNLCIPAATKLSVVFECPKRPAQPTHTRAQAGQGSVSTRRVGRKCEAAERRERGGELIIHSQPIKCVLSCVGQCLAQWGLVTWAVQWICWEFLKIFKIKQVSISIAVQVQYLLPRPYWKSRSEFNNLNS